MSLDIVLDPRNEQELLNQLTRYLFNRSNGRLTNLNESNPLIFLLEAQVFAGSELLWYVNQLPSKLLLTFLNRFETLQDTPQKATGTLILNLTSPLSSSYTISSLEVSDGERLYRLVSPVVFTSGTTQATGIIEAFEEGSEYNVPAFSINRIITPVAFLSSVTNPNALTNGISETTPEEAIDRFVSGFRDSQLISVEDFRAEVNRLVGSTYTVRVYYDGSINVLVGNPTSRPPISLLETIYQTILSKAVLTTSLTVQEIAYKDCSVFLSVKSDNLTETLPDLIYQELLSVLKDREVISTTDLIELSGKLGLRFVDGWINKTWGVELQPNEMFNPKHVQLKINGFDFYFGDSEDKE